MSAPYRFRLPTGKVPVNLKSKSKKMKLLDHVEEPSQEMQRGFFYVTWNGLLLVNEVELIQLARLWDEERRSSVEAAATTSSDPKDALKQGFITERR